MTPEEFGKLPLQEQEIEIAVEREKSRKAREQWEATAYKLKRIYRREAASHQLGCKCSCCKEYR